MPDHLRGVRVLVVDDNPTMRNVLTNLLHAWGAVTAAVADGPSALGALKRTREGGAPFRIAVLDMQMPGMNGLELARIIRDADMLRETRLMLCCSMGHQIDTKTMFHHNISACLAKPVRQSELFECLTMVLSGTVTTLPVDEEAVSRLSRQCPAVGSQILLVEDNITNQRVTLGILKKMGLCADTVANGLEALRALEEVPYDLVLMDVQMPGMNGFEAAERIRDPGSDVLCHGIPIIAMTAHALEGDRERCLAAGMNDYIAKPFDPLVLAQALDRWLPVASVQHSVEQAVPSVGPAHGHPVFDRVGMLARLMGDTELVRGVIEAFLVDMPWQLDALRGCLDEGDGELAALKAHTIKGAAAIVGGELVREVAREVESAAKAGDLSGARRLVDSMEEELRSLQLSLQEELRGGP